MRLFLRTEQISSHTSLSSQTLPAGAISLLHLCMRSTIFQLLQLSSSQSKAIGELAVRACRTSMIQLTAC